MDDELKAIVDAVREVEKLARESVLTPARGGRAPVLREQEATVLDAAASLVEVAREFVDLYYPYRMTTADARGTVNDVRKGLAALAERLRAAGERPGARGA
ncbi:hypothetical protein RMN57_03075 [Kitasatospora sp. CM 4170]|uniref:Uncharacterized protein n=1 Tax=Kitasatospora aburaviensis TaxID=67265 RepID=A0ABW1EUZ6_9ACTN|nr:hypothetical protein [Kitasatospora sp. CM 4170]WNM43755.1 hypothetical protein RMN57_03075 [Kitasatospora sp. CM 4170]